MIEYRGYIIKRDPQHTLFHIHSKAGSLPLSLTGLFTDERAYKSVIDAYIATQEQLEADKKALEAAVAAAVAEQVKSDAVKFEELKKEAEEINRKKREAKEPKE